MTEPGTTLVITDRSPDYEVEVNGRKIYDSHLGGHLTNDQVAALVAEAAGIEVKQSDYIKAPGDEAIDVATMLLRIGEAHGMRTWALDRAPHDEPPEIPAPRL